MALVGDRQFGREADQHVRRVAPVTSLLTDSIQTQLRHGRYAPSRLYGDGWTAQAIGEALATLEPYVQKRLHYIQDAASDGYGHEQQAALAGR